MPEPLTQQIVFLYVRDLQASAAFYAGVLGLALARDQGACHIYRTAPNAYIGLCQRTEVTPQSDSLIVTLVTDDVDGWYARAVAAGAQVESPPVHSDVYHITHCFLRDPDGYRVEIQRFDEPLDP
jgi:catechol 2,3-dioxygenase-like lactoylglutathione lyase family enzyme